MERSLDDGADQEPPEDGRIDVSEFVEVDPTGRYGRYDDVLGKGAYKTVYKAFDDLDGIEVAWNQVKLQDMVHKGGDMERLFSELHLLKTLKHKNIIKFYNSWVDTRNQNVNFITEIFTSGTLRQYRKKHKHVNLRAIKHWSRQILQGLVYLHSHKPPIIHRDLKCDNVFINGNNGEVKIGDLGLATILRQAPAAHSVIGTPEFMAPELYEEHYNELVDIYSFGMCLLEMLTSEYPYSECANAAQIYKKVTAGKRPAALSKVKDPETRQFLEKCLAAAPQRLHAKELLFDPFLRNDKDHEVSESNHNSSMLNHIEDIKCVGPASEGRGHESLLLDASAPNSERGLISSQILKSKQGGNVENANSSDSPHALDSSQPWKRTRDFRIKGRKLDDKKVLVRIRITSSTGGIRYIQFDFDVEVDTAMSVASEMVSELELSDQDVTTIADMIDTEITLLIPDWKTGVSLDGERDSEPVNEQQAAPTLHNLTNEVVNDEHNILHEDPSSSAIGSADDTEVGDVPRNEAFNMYGRFEEVDCGQNGANLNHKEQDASGFLSDYSSEPNEDRGSDLSLDGNLDNSSSVSLTSQMLEDIRNDSPSSMTRRTSGHEEDGGMTSECDPSMVAKCDADNAEDSEVFKFLVMQHERELQLLQSKHEQALLDFKAQRREALKVARTSPVEEERSLASMEVATETLNHMDGNRECCNKEDGERNIGAPENLVINNTTQRRTADSLVSTSRSESLSRVRANDLHVQAHNPPVLVVNDRGSSDTASIGGDNHPKIAREHAVIVDMRDTTIHEHVKPPQPLSTKRESYLELYKGQSNQRDKPVSPKPSEVSCTSDGISEEQLRKQQVQKSIADLEAKTLEGLLQSKGKYACKAPKGNATSSVQNIQASASGANGRQTNNNT